MWMQLNQLNYSYLHDLCINIEPRNLKCNILVHITADRSRLKSTPPYYTVQYESGDENAIKNTAISTITLLMQNTFLTCIKYFVIGLKFTFIYIFFFIVIAFRRNKILND